MWLLNDVIFLAAYAVVSFITLPILDEIHGRWFERRHPCSCAYASDDPMDRAREKADCSRHNYVTSNRHSVINTVMIVATMAVELIVLLELHRRYALWH